jgi:predicted metal-dependent phosphoesterase TrpH
MKSIDMTVTSKFSDVDLHIHSKYSQDSILEPHQVVKYAAKAGLSVIAITDHNTVKGSLDALKLKPKTDGLIIIPGIEVQTNIGDLVVLFAEEEIRTRDFNEIVEEAKEKDYLTILPHPFRGHSDLKKVIPNVDAIETVNGRRPKHENEKAQKLAAEFKKPQFCSSDSHFSFEIGKTRTRLYTNIDDAENLRKVIFEAKRDLLFNRSRLGQQSTHYLSCAVQIAKKIGFIKYA